MCLIGGPGARRKHYDMTGLFILHIGTAIGGGWYLLTQPTNWTIWSLFIVGYLMSNFGFSVGFHRYFTHRSFETSKPMRYVLGIMGQMSAMTSVKIGPPITAATTPLATGPAMCIARLSMAMAARCQS